MIEISDLSKVYGGRSAVDHLTVTVRPGVVTGFLGPNGAGKSTTIRAVLGLDRPTGGQTRVLGRPYRDHPAPLRSVGALLDARAVHPGRTGRQHLTALAATHGIGRRRVTEVLTVVGLEAAADRRVRGYSLGMAQRLGVAAALLGDPAVLVLDEPVNGLDPDGIRWMRELLRDLAAEGRTVFLSSHLISEMTLTADHLVVIGRGRLLADVPMAALTAGASAVRVRSGDLARLVALLAGPGTTVTRDGDAVRVTGRTAEQIARTALDHGVLLSELTPVHASLEDAYLTLTRSSVEFGTDAGRAAA